MYYEIVQWNPDSTVHAQNDRSPRKGRYYEAESFVRDMKEWCARYPNALKLITMTKGGQLRFWFGEPKAWRSDYVDSCGHNLFVHISGDNDPLLSRLLLVHVLKEMEARCMKLTIEGVEVWRLQHLQQ